ncbi:hypothetical protein PRZ48_004603 [Zasmidium cellare]|uniref:Amidohydrolase-related domain-containing protein n=1 Tax=Zasmidium cellare TaxID=395010 RepID=A0ABR0ER63_ZASCE|nr:hypothetical protein PRZ48_004603 [Zasmidium cellare]
MAKSTALVPPNAWETHIHVFEPQKFAFSPDRAYTPATAALNDYPASKTGCTNVVVVQGTVQGEDPAPVLDVLNASPAQGDPPGLRRGLVVLDLDKHTDEDLDKLHAAGVRGIRLHEVSWGFGTQPTDSEFAERLRYAASRLNRLNWVIDVYTHPKTWLALVPTIEALPSSTIIIADHWACLRPGDEEGAECQAILHLLRSKRIFVKLSSTERQSSSPGSIESLEKMAKLFVGAGPDRLLYGSDWPHTALPGPRQGKTREQRLTDVEEFREVNLASHVRSLRDWIQDEKVWQDLWVNTPRRLFE